jgi:hypothetical protein
MAALRELNPILQALMGTLFTWGLRLRCGDGFSHP